MMQDRRLTHAEFYQAAECLKKHKQRFLDERPTTNQAAKLLSQLSGLAIGDTTMAELLKTTNVRWQSRRPDVANANSVRHHAIRTLARAVHQLYNRLEEPMPGSLQALYDSVCKPNGAESNGTLNGASHD
jgi:hypothetical protein